MSRLFLAHSSYDKDFTRKLAKELVDIGHEVWFDEWEIKVGESIVDRINAGLNALDFLVLVLSPASVASDWVRREMNAGLMHELAGRRVIVLPVLVEDCEIPPLVSDKRYADFRGTFEVGFRDLGQAIPPSLRDLTKSNDSNVISDAELSEILRTARQLLSPGATDGQLESFQLKLEIQRDLQIRRLLGTFDIHSQRASRNFSVNFDSSGSLHRSGWTEVARMRTFAVPPWESTNWHAMLDSVFLKAAQYRRGNEHFVIGVKASPSDSAPDWRFDVDGENFYLLFKGTCPEDLVSEPTQ